MDNVTSEEEQQLADAFARLQADYTEPDPIIQSQSGETLVDLEEDDDEEESEDEETSGDESGEEDSTEDEEDDDDDDIALPDGTVISRDELGRLAELQRLLDPATRSTLEQVQQIAPPVVAQPVAAVPAELEPPADLDLDDPSTRILWEGYVALHQNQQRINQDNMQRQQQDAVEQVERAVSDWSAKYKFTGDTLQTIRTKAGQTNVAAALVSSGKSVYEATNAALEQAFWSDATLRQQYLTAAAADDAAREKKNRTKTRKLGALSGRGTSTGGNKPVQEMTRDERREAMTRDIADHLARN